MTTDFQDQDNEFEELGEGTGNRPTPPPARGNRPFFIAIGIIGTIFVLALVFLLITLFTRGPQQSSQTSDQAKTIVAYNTQVAGTATADTIKVLAVQATADALAKAPPPTATASATPPVIPTATSVLAIPTATRSLTPTLSSDSLTRTSVALTLGVGGVGAGSPVPTTQTNGTPQPTATALPKTGFADEVGLPGLLAMAAVLLIVIVLARRTRLATR